MGQFSKNTAYRLINLKKAIHEFRHGGNPNTSYYQFFYGIKHTNDIKTVKWQ
ncbi:hypothetical protein [Oenococcus oeni]|uniref:hypothetical protein n=1 Tax=Oenococcus oeni TaxID=1247 RepID=UPI0010B3E8F6|nr:hypothetical protein [Oenococcus oeni]SYW08050.1 conserved hypothetical protein [Oenococcus oeni]